ncbi:hypothetical protein ACFOLJ_19545 [Rugamonas sp. CCM 8940]|uniref:hypothetical protein n=1 Tax=Rugamonas sp. CCM 8940 TaxID=2765359 RepID=UPI0018F5C121|nr:hypothetical protein [Rugamonas sp. CCM 8940]MBJ7312302.1 hypothetical protein [Rugamonas sp. CCM 8940]
MKTLIFVIAALLAGCSAVPITQEGMLVRQIQPNDSTTCKFIRVVEVSGGMFYSSVAEGRRDMLAKVRNEVAALNGNAYVPTAVVAEHGISLPYAQADAYKCP